MDVMSHYLVASRCHIEELHKNDVKIKMADMNFKVKLIQFKCQCARKRIYHEYEVLIYKFVPAKQ